MRRPTGWSAVSVCLLASVFGCGGSTESQPAPSGDATSPDQAVFKFLDAVRKGDDTGAGNMLTDLARAKTQEVNMVVSPPGSDTARFQVGNVTPIADDVARVACNWTDLDQDGQPRTDAIVWTVKRRGQQWRIAGMEAQIFPDRPPIMLNFEDPEAMIRQQQLAEQEAVRRVTEQDRQAQKTTQDPFQANPR